MVPVLEQFQSFFFTVLIGLLLGFIVDGYRTLANRVPGKSALRMAGDILLWVFLAGLVFFLLLLNNWGEVRAYVLIGMAVGLMIYRRKCSSYVVRFWQTVFVAAGKLWRLAVALLLFPFRFMQKILFVPLGIVSMGLDWLWRLWRGILRRLGLSPRRWREKIKKLLRRRK